MCRVSKPTKRWWVGRVRASRQACRCTPAIVWERYPNTNTPWVPFGKTKNYARLAPQDVATSQEEMDTLVISLALFTEPQVASNILPLVLLLRWPRYCSVGHFKCGSSFGNLCWGGGNDNRQSTLRTTSSLPESKTCWSCHPGVATTSDHFEQGGLFATFSEQMGDALKKESFTTRGPQGGGPIFSHSQVLQ